jgi:AraC-like DNA-binding protein
VTVPRHYSGGFRLPRHRHLGAYAAVVLAGEFVEAGDRGRYRLTGGKVVFHSAFEAHRDDFGRTGAVVLDLPLTRCPPLTTGVLDAMDAVVRLARLDVRAAAALLLENVRPSEGELADWPDELARALADEPHLCLATWAEQCGLSPQTVSRGFRRAYGTSPKRFRAEHRTQRALRVLPRWTGTLGGLAAEVGFADQAHMTRAVLSLTGWTPGQLRAKWIQDGSRASG